MKGQKRREEEEEEEEADLRERKNSKWKRYIFIYNIDKFVHTVFNPLSLGNKGT